jgi:hypothetical protein
VNLQKIKERKQETEKRHHHNTGSPDGERQWALSEAHPFIYFSYNSLSFWNILFLLGILEILNKRGSTSL